MAKSFSKSCACNISILYKASQNHIQNTVQRLARAHPFAASRDYWILIFTILVPSGAVDRRGRPWSRQTRIIFC